MAKNNMIMDRPITSDSLRGIMRTAMEAQREIAPYLRNWSKIPEQDKSRISAWIDSVTTLWKEVQLVGYRCTDDVVKLAFSK